MAMASYSGIPEDRERRENAHQRNGHRGLQSDAGRRQAAHAGRRSRRCRMRRRPRAGAIHIGKGVIERDIETKVPEKETTLVLYCGGGYRSALAADALQTMGYTNVISLDGGWRAIQASGLPLE